MVARSRADQIRRELDDLMDPARAVEAAPYYGIVPGGYGEGDVLLGMPVPVQRRVAKRHRDASLGDMAELLQGEVHEHRFVALVLMRERFERFEAEREAVASAYLRLRRHVNNWDLVDVSAPHLLADRMRADPAAVVDPLIPSDSVWDRRIAMIATFSLIRADEFSVALGVAERLLDDDHDLIHKATGWMLREIGKRDVEALRGFLRSHAAEMPRTALRYSIERLDPAERRRWMAA